MSRNKSELLFRLKRVAEIVEDEELNKTDEADVYGTKKVSMTPVLTTHIIDLHEMKTC